MEARYDEMTHEGINLHNVNMTNESSPDKAAMVREIQRRLNYLLSAEKYSTEEKAVIIRSFFQALEDGEA